MDLLQGMHPLKQTQHLNYNLIVLFRLEEVISPGKLIPSLVVHLMLMLYFIMSGELFFYLWPTFLMNHMLLEVLG